MSAVGDPADFFFNRILTKMSSIDTPGYFSTTFYNMEGKLAFERAVFFPETFFINLEKEAIKRDPDNAKLKLYTVGKQFGYGFAWILRLSRSDIKTAITNTAKFLETLYAERLVISSVDLDAKAIVLDTKNLAVTSKNGMGYVLTVGGWAGICCYLFNDYTLECSAIKEAKGEYKLVSAPPTKLTGMDIKFMASTQAPEEMKGDEKYREYNTPTGRQSSMYGMRKMIELGIVSYSKGKMILKGPDAILLSVEAHLIGGITENLDKESIFLASYKCFYDIAKAIPTQKDPVLYLSQLLTALGFGILEPVKSGKKVIFNFFGYPWTVANQQDDSFEIIRGSIKGFMESNTKKIFDLSAPKYKISEGVFKVSLEMV